MKSKTENRVPSRKDYVYGGSQSSFVHLLTLVNVSVLHEDVHAAGLASF